MLITFTLATYLSHVKNVSLGRVFFTFALVDGDISTIAVCHCISGRVIFTFALVDGDISTISVCHCISPSVALLADFLCTWETLNQETLTAVWLFAKIARSVTFGR